MTSSAGAAPPAGNAPVPPPAPPSPPAAPPPPFPPRRRIWLTVLLCLAIFAAGGVVGAGVTVIRTYRAALSALKHPERTPARIALRLQRKLDLSDEQTQRIEVILRRRHKGLLELRAELMQRVDPELDALEGEVAAELEPEQAARWSEQFRVLRRDWTSGPRAPGLLGR